MKLDINSVFPHLRELLLSLLLLLLLLLFIIIIIIITIIINMLKLHTVALEQFRLIALDQWLNFLRFCVKKTPQTSRTFRRIFAEYKTVVFRSSTILFSNSVSESLSHCLHFFGVVY